MATRDRIMEFKIGLFVLAAVGLFVFAILRLDVVRTEPRRPLVARFDFAGGLEAGAAVQMAGVPIGEVKGLKIVRSEDGRTRVEVIASVRTDVIVPADSEITISTHGLMGTKYLEIMPGSQGGLPEGGVFTGRDPVRIDAMLATGERMAGKLEHTVDLVNQLVEDENFRATLKNNGENITALIAELRQAAHSVNAMLDSIKSGHGLVGKLLTDETVFQDVKDTIADIKRNPWKLWKKK